MDDLSQLKAVALFADMSEDELQALRKEMKHYQFAPGEVIIREGDPGDSFHIIVDGQVAFLTVDSGGREIQLDQAGVGQWFGELSLLTGEPRSARVKAVTPVMTLAIEREAFRNFLSTHTHAALDVLAVLGRRLAGADALLRQSASKNVNEIVQQEASLWERIADMIARVSSSAPFVIVHMIWFGLWIGINLVRGEKGFDPYPFGLLTMVVSLEAIFLSIFVLVAQGRSGEIDRIAADVDHQVNMKAEQQTGLILARLDDLQRGMHHIHNEHLALLRELHRKMPGDVEKPRD